VSARRTHRALPPTPAPLGTAAEKYFSNRRFYLNQSNRTDLAAENRTTFTDCSRQRSGKLSPKSLHMKDHCLSLPSSMLRCWFVLLLHGQGIVRKSVVLALLILILTLNSKEQNAPERFTPLGSPRNSEEAPPPLDMSGDEPVPTSSMDSGVAKSGSNKQKSASAKSPARAESQMDSGVVNPPSNKQKDAIGQALPRADSPEETSTTIWPYATAFILIALTVGGGGVVASPLKTPPPAIYHSHCSCVRL
jgi:hypothetical protein